MAALSTTAAAAQLRARLDETADALAQADLARLLSCEMQIQSALSSLSTASASGRDRESIAEELEGIRASLVRCRRLGMALTDYVQISLSDARREPLVHTFRHSA